MQSLNTQTGVISLSIFEDGVPPVFRIKTVTDGAELLEHNVTVTTIRPDGTNQIFAFCRSSDFLKSTTEIPEPHDFKAVLKLPTEEHSITFEEHDHGDHGMDTRDHNMRAAYIHVIADAAISVLAIIGLLLAKTFGWLWMDPLVGIIGALVIANWSFGLIRDTGAILVDMSPSEKMANKVRAAIDAAGDRLLDLHIWRLGPGHFGAIVSVATKASQRGPSLYHAALRQFKGLSHISVEVHSQPLTKTIS